VGIDLWSQGDLAGNTADATLRNAELEGVRERVEVRTGDMRDLPFADGEFDAVVASLSIHNIPRREDRRRATSEIARVLKPGGRLSLLDFRCTSQYAEDLKALGLSDVRLSGMRFGMFPPVKIVTARR
jgi:ubiquinone/menaquinone biosynthesis C-methylase UbiE